MEPKKILIAAAFVILASQALAGCSPQAEKPAASEAKTLVQTAELGRKVTDTVTLELAADSSEEEVVVEVTLKNPERKAIQSAEAWLTYDPTKLKGVSINTDNSDFDLPAPYEQEFDEVQGLVKIGRGATQAITSNQINVAEIRFEVLEEGTTMINVFNFKEDLSGDASANVVIDGMPYNILKKPENPVLIIQ